MKLYLYLKNGIPEIEASETPDPAPPVSPPVPELGRYVLGHYTGDEWCDYDDLEGCRWVVVKRISDDEGDRWETVQGTPFDLDEIDRWKPLPR